MVASLLARCLALAYDERVIIPIGHDHGIRRVPWVTIGIIAICTLVQLYSSLVAPSEADFRHLHDLYLQAASPEEAAVISEQAATLAESLPILRWGYQTDSGFGFNLLASAFVHDGWLHLIGNMLFLWLAGAALEDRYGKLRFALFYLVGAAVATYAFEASYSGAGTILVGASGAVSACLGAFLVHFSRSEITFWYLLMYRTGTFRWPAWLALPLWLGDQLLWSSLQGATGGVSGVAYAAHIGGFVFGAVGGLAMGKLFPRDGLDEDEDEAVEGIPAARVVAGAGAPPPIEEGRARLEERYQQCLEAIKARDVAVVKMLASRTIIDLARGKDDARIMELYNAIANQLTRVQLTDGAFAAVASAADTLGDPRSYVAIAGQLLDQHPGSLQVPKILWRLAQLYRDDGNPGLEAEALRTLAEKFPRDPLAHEARQLLSAR